MIRLTDRLTRHGRAAGTARAALWLLACGLCGLGGVAQGQTVYPPAANLPSGNYLYWGNPSVISNNSFAVSGSAAVSFMASGSIVLGPGFQATAGATGTVFQTSIANAPPAPVLSSVSPPNGVQNSSVPVTLTGSNFVTLGTTVSASTGITASNVVLVNANQITATLAIGANAPVGNGTVTVTTAGGSTTATFTVQATQTVTILTNPPNLQITVNGATQGTPYSWTCSTESISVDVPSPQSASAGTQYVFDHWGSNSPKAHTISCPSTNYTDTVFLDAQYLVTATAWPAGKGTVTGGGWHGAGAVSLSATPASSSTDPYVFANFSGQTGCTTNVQCMHNPLTINLTGPITVTANFAPTVWKGINYSPAYHSYWRMLYDWNAYNLGPTVDADLANLASNGFNMVHLYIWDQATFQGVTMSTPVCGPSNDRTNICFGAANPSDLSGFINAGGNASQSPNGQWQYLNQFVTLAENHGMFVVIEFVSAWELGNLRPYNLSSSQLDGVWQAYADWIGQFVQYLSGTNAHQNILAWGSYWGLSPDIGKTSLSNPCVANPDPNSSIDSYTFAKLYYSIDSVSRQYSPAPGILGQVSTGFYGLGAIYRLEPENLQPPSGSGVFVRPNSENNPAGTVGYDFQPYKVQQMGWTARQILTQVYGVQKDPDLYNLGGIYNANSHDLYAALSGLSSGNIPVPSNSDYPLVPTIQIPAAKLWASEWATSSSLGPYSYGPPNIGYSTNLEEYNGYPSQGDSQTPTTTLAGQQTWTNNTLCAAVRANVQKLAYWAMYDPYTLFTTNGWPESGYPPGQSLAWAGYWGLAYEQPSLQYKPAASPLQQYYLNGTLTCPGGDGGVWNAQPTLSLTPLSPYYTVNQPVRVMWTASDFSAFSSEGASATLTCDTEAPLNPADFSFLQPASCAIIDAQPSTTAGNHTVWVTAIGTNGASATTATATVAIGVAPQLNAVSALPPGDPTAYITLWGEGFAAAGNTIILTKQGAGSVTFSDGAGIVYESPTQINVNITGGTGPLTAGTWTVSVNNNYPGTTSSTGVSVTIQ